MLNFVIVLFFSFFQQNVFLIFPNEIQIVAITVIQCQVD